MKPIKLLEEQKEKLLEMCKVLFPDYAIRVIKPVHSTPDTFFIQMGLKKSIKYDFEIHWFEFCMTHLPEKINVCTEWIELWKTNNPIDFLYEEFLKLKK